MSDIPRKHVLRPISEIRVSYALDIKRKSIRFDENEVLRSDTRCLVEVRQIIESKIEADVTASLLPITLVPGIICRFLPRVGKLTAGVRSVNSDCGSNNQRVRLRIVGSVVI